MSSESAFFNFKLGFCILPQGIERQMTLVESLQQQFFAALKSNAWPRA
jgi:hypothetical protein